MTTELEIWAGLVTFVSLATWPLWTFKPVYTFRPICSFWMVWRLLVSLVIKAS